ncbi:amidase family protein [Streptomyces sp. HUAS MG91]|uniref:Amidase family protein n=1 Tax=Streptomyces tabacisoli TaxID=3156398 RepID=A0AAU8J296_9ACTN
MSSLITMTAREVVRLLRSGDVSPVAVLEELRAHTEVADERVNALPIRFFDAALGAARELERRAPAERGMLAGLPVAVKDYNDVAGQRTTHGSPLTDEVAAESDAMVRVLESNGAVPYAKSNVPEFAGGHTYNTLFGASRNPWNLGRSVGGSSGGSAAALASGSAWLATGNDLGGSLRTPSGFNGTVGLRPTPGRIPRRRPATPFDTLWVEGPMARNVPDLALMLDAMVGSDPHDPLTRPECPASFLDRLDTFDAPRRVGYSPDLGVLPVEREVRRVCAGALKHIEALGADVVEECPDFSGAYDAFQALRGHLVAALHGGLLAAHRDRIKPDIVWNIESGLNQSVARLQQAERTRGELFHRVLDFFGDHDLLVCPSAPLEPFPVEWTSPRTLDGVATETYIDWIAITFFVSLTGCPVVALPCGFSASGLPVGLQLIGRPGDEARLLSYAARLEQSFGVAGLLPVTPREPGAPA